MNLVRRNGQATTLPVMVSSSMQAGDSLYHRQAGGGGHGDPLQRDPAAVLDDVRNEKISSNAARDQYGVVLHQEPLAVDHAATEQLRQTMAADTRETE